MVSKNFVRNRTAEVTMVTRLFSGKRLPLRIYNSDILTNEMIDYSEIKTWYLEQTCYFYLLVLAWKFPVGTKACFMAGLLAGQGISELLASACSVWPVLRTAFRSQERPSSPDGTAFCTKGPSTACLWLVGLSNILDSELGRRAVV